MNSVYGKFALAITRMICGELTTNSDMILEMLKSGSLLEYKALNIGSEDKVFYQVGGVSSQKSSTANIMIAAFITSYGRIQLNRIQRDCDKLGFIPEYSDTDSVYFSVDKNRLTNHKMINEAMAKLSELHCHATRLGACKFETEEDVGNCLE